MRRLVIAAGLGLAAGLASGLFGIGGGLVYVPGLVLVLHLDQHRAHGTSGTAVVVTAAAGMTRFLIADALDWWVAALLAAGAVFGASIGARLMGRIPATWLRRIFTLFSILAALRMVTGGLEGEPGLPSLPHTVGLAALLFAIGLVTGGFVAILGLGGGSVYVPVLVACFGLNQHVAQGTSLAVVVATTISAAWVHLQRRRIDVPVAGVLGVAGMAGGLLGAEIAL
jgi:uncharacterized membrane protein YfcA